MKLRTRIAPTPSGYLHLGNAWSFVLTWLAARSQDGFIHLRIDDLDADRARDDYLEDIFASLDWLGIDWDSGPGSAEEFKSTFSQRLRLKRYAVVLDQIHATGKVYACTCSREQIKRDSMVAGTAVYAGTCRGKAADGEEEQVWRYRVSESGVKARDVSGALFELHPHRDMGDFVVRRKNGEPSYQLASGVDDEDLNINFIVRGLDLMPSTGAQLSLAHALDWKMLPQARFWHHALMLNDASEKLSKSTEGGAKGLESLSMWREKFPDALPVLRFFARHLGMEPSEIHSLRDMIPRFRVERVGDKPLRFSEFLQDYGKE